jgi:uncharacterized protein YkwD
LLANSLGVVLILAIIAAAVSVLRMSDEGAVGSVVVSPGVPGLSVTVESQDLYPDDDPWSAYLAPEGACPGGDTRSAPVRAQQQTMICLLNWARHRRGLSSLPEQPLLSRAAALKARDIRGCREFAHEACEKPADAVVSEAGYDPAGWGENLYLGSSAFGRPRVAVDGWLNSTGHRENLFRADWDEQGVALLEVPLFEGQPDVAVWVSHFGHR